MSRGTYMTKLGRVASILLAGAMALQANAPRAALIDRGQGLIYDTVLDVTWIQDVALARTLGNDSDGLFDWFGAKAWADQLVYGGYDDWRLPTLTPINGIAFERNFRCDGSADYGYGIASPDGLSAGFTGNELAYMFHVNLGNQSRCKGEGDDRTWGPDVGIQNASFIDGIGGHMVSFMNLQGFKENFWTDPVPGNSSYAWMFKYSGFNDWAASFQIERAWAVRDGDVFLTIPEPSTSLLMFGLIAMLGTSLAARRIQPAARVST